MLYMIGGSPCSGKSTIASLLARQYQLLHIKLDDLVEEMMSQASADSQPICLLRQDRNPEQIWMRNPEEMADEEWHFYEEIFPYVKSYLIKIKTGISWWREQDCCLTWLRSLNVQRLPIYA